MGCLNLKKLNSTTEHEIRRSPGKKCKDEASQSSEPMKKLFVVIVLVAFFLFGPRRFLFGHSSLASLVNHHHRRVVHTPCPTPPTTVCLYKTHQNGFDSCRFDTCINHRARGRTGVNKLCESDKIENDILETKITCVCGTDVK